MNTIKIGTLILCLGLLISSCDFSNPISSKSSTIPLNLEKDTLPSVSEYHLLDTDSINQISLKFWREGDYQTSLKLTNLAYDKAKRENNNQMLAKVLNTLGLIQWRLGNNEDALTSFSQAGKIAEQLELFMVLGKTHTNRCMIYNLQEKFDEAIFHNNEAIRIFQNQNEYVYLAIALNNKGNIFRNRKLNDSAKIYYLAALKNYSKVNYNDGKACTYYNLSELYHSEGKQNLALESIQNSLKYGITIQRKQRISDAYKKLSEIHESFNQKDSALKYYKLYEVENRNILIANQSKVLAEYQAKLGSKVKTLQIENLKKEQQLTKNLYWFITIIILALLMLLGFFIYQHFQKMRFNKINLETQLDNSTKIVSIKEQELKHYILDLSKKNEIIDLLKNEINESFQTKETNKNVSDLLGQKILTEEDWNIFKNKFNNIYPRFFPKIHQSNLLLTEGEIRFLVLLHLQLTSKEMAKILGISPQSVRVSKMRLKKKLNTDGYDNVESFLKILMNS